MTWREKVYLPEDEEYILGIRRELHRYPEVGFELTNTVNLVKRELRARGIAYTEQFGKGSVVAVINEACKGWTVGLRADMDALPIEEHTGLCFSSRNPGSMHACGHDAHTAMLLGTARILKRLEGELKCRVKLLFQPSEEGEISGAKMMADRGVAEDVDEILALHVNNEIPSGHIGICSGAFHAGCHPYTVTFHGRSCHATRPQRGQDALAMAVKAYGGIQMAKCCEMDPFSEYVLAISALHGGTAHNVLAGEARMLITLRFYDMEVEQLLDSRIKLICRHAAEELGGEVRFDDRISTFPVVNDGNVIARIREVATHALGPSRVQEIGRRMSSEDFAHFSTRKPGAIFHLGTGNREKGCVQELHTCDFMIDEEALVSGSLVMVQYVREYTEKGYELDL